MRFGCDSGTDSNRAMRTLKSEGEKPPKIRKKKFPGTKFLGTFGPPATEKTEKIGKIKGTLVRKVPGNLRSQEFVFFFSCGFSPPYKSQGPLNGGASNGGVS